MLGLLERLEVLLALPLQLPEVGTDCLKHVLKVTTQSVRKRVGHLLIVALLRDASLHHSLVPIIRIWQLS